MHCVRTGEPEDDHDSDWDDSEEEDVEALLIRM